jgi:hypothetical protein
VTLVSKYEPLQRFLQQQGQEEIRVTFADLEQILGFPLPSSRRHRAWWSNNPDNNVMTRAWLAAGYQTAQVDLEGRRLVFRRVGGPRSPVEDDVQGSDSASGRSEKAHPLLGWMKGLTTIGPGVDLTEPADPDWAKSW